MPTSRWMKSCEVTADDRAVGKGASSRLAIGTKLTRGDLLHLALMSSENRAAHALGRNYPGGMPAFVKAMNEKAKSLGMTASHFVEPTGPVQRQRGESRGSVATGHGGGPESDHP